MSGLDETELEKDRSHLTFYEINKFHELDVAIILGYEKVVDNLIDVNVDFEPMRNLMIKFSSLKYAIKTGKTNITKILLEAGFKMD